MTPGKKQNVINALAFILLALPGLALVLAGAIGIVSAIGSSGRDLPRIGVEITSPTLAVVWYVTVFMGGSFACLVGVRRERQPLYVLVIWSLPAGALLGLLLSDSAKGAAGLGAGVAAFTAVALVSRYYDKHAKGSPSGDAAS